MRQRLQNASIASRGTLIRNAVSHCLHFVCNGIIPIFREVASKILREAGIVREQRNHVGMRIGVLSDTHDHLGYLRRAVDALCDLQVELALYAGDYVAPFVVNELHKWRDAL